MNILHQESVVFQKSKAFRLISLILSFLTISIFLSAQPWMDKAFQSKSPNFLSIQKEANDYWSVRNIKEKGKGYKAYKRWEWYWQSRVIEDGSFPAANHTINQFDRYVKSQKNQTRSMPANWTSLGPNFSPGGGYAGVGRINSIAFHPSNVNIFYVGAAGGGLWKTTDGGVNYTTSTDLLGSLGVSGIAVLPSNPDVIFIATGDGDGFDNYSIGVLKSTNGGTSFSTTGLNWNITNFRVIRKIILDPDNENSMMIASSFGIWRTTDGGANWTSVQSGNFYDIEANPDGSTNIFYACTRNMLFRSTDNGATWSNVQTILGTNRIALAIAPSDDTHVYALCSDSINSGFKAFYRSTNSGSSYTLRSSSPNLLGWETNGSDVGGQGWYDLVATVDPTNKDIIFVGGVNTWKSVDGGANWTINTHWFAGAGPPAVHADKHAFEWRGTTLFGGNDGGVYKTSNGGTTWTEISGNLTISQMYRLGVSASDGKVICGLQDNGTKLRSSGGTWTDEIGGDGMECSIHPTSSNIMYGEYQNGGLHGSTDGGINWRHIRDSIPGDPNGSWITPHSLDPVSSSTIYAGYTKVWKSINNGTSWTDISGAIFGGNLTILNVAPSNNQIIYAGRSNVLYRTTNAGTTWDSLSSPGSNTNMIAIHPTDPNTLWAVRQNYSAGAKVYKSTNGGSTWTNVSGTLPNIPANCIVYDPCTLDGIYVGMDVGIYYRDNSLSDWVLFSDQLPNVEIQELEILKSTNKIYAATYGRGLWSSDLYNSTPLIVITSGTIMNESCTGNDGSIVLNFTNIPNGTYTINYKKNGVAASASRTISSNTTTLINLGFGTYSDFSITHNGCTGFLAGPITIIKSDTELPQITCPSNIAMSNNSGLCTAIVSYTTPVGTDNCPGPTTIQTAGLASGSEFTKGVTTNTFRVTDTNGNTRTCSFTVTVNDTELPVIACPANIVTGNDVGVCTAIETYTTPVGTDNCTGQTTVLTAGLASGSAFPNGVTTNTFTVTDASGNTKTCSFTATVIDTELPVISCPANITTGNDAGICTAVETYTTPVGTDNCTGQSTVRTTGLASGSAFPIGVTTNTFTVTDASGNTKTCSFTVTVNDTELPVITCPVNIVTGNDAGVCIAVETYATPVGTDNCTGQSTVLTAGLASGSAFPKGVTTNTFTVTDASGNTKTCSFTVTVNDTELPVITCPANIITGNDAGVCTAVETYTAPVGTDNCTGQSTVRTTGLASGSAFPIGITTNTFTVTDASGNTKTCSLTVTVNDTELPVITCPANITNNNDVGVCSAVATYVAPVGADNCTGQSTVRTIGLASGTAFPVGVTTNTFTVTDASGNTKTCSFTVIVTDNELPAISCPANIVTNNDPGVCIAVETYATPSGTDNCTGQNTVRTAGLASGSAFPKGVTTNTFTVTDASGNTKTCSFTVTVNDTELPVIACPSNIVTVNDAGVCTAIETYTTPVGTDNCTGQSTVRTAGLASGSAFPKGVTTNTFTITDAAGNAKTCSFTVTVNDTELPVITCPANIVTSNDPGVCTAIESYTTPSGTDNCSGQNTIQTAGLVSGSAFSSGVTTNTFKVTDASGNTKTCSFTVTVNETEVPSVTCPANIVQGTNTGQCQANVTLAGATATDNCQVDGITYSPASGSLFSLGASTVIVTATDVSGNTNTCSFTVTVNDTELPIITCPANIVIGNDNGVCTAVETYTTPSGTDNCTGQNTVRTTGLASGSVFPKGVTTNTFKVTDAAGNTKTCSFTVTVNDTELPAITCPANIVTNNDPGVCTAVETYAAPSGTDNCTGQSTTRTAGLASGSAFPTGVTTNTFTVTDASGNTKTCSFTVTVNETEVPSVTCPANIVQGTDPGQCNAIITLVGATATDNCQLDNITYAPASGSTFNTGTTSVIVTATDASGNTNSCSFTVTVNDNELPAITCPANIITSNDAGVCTAIETYSTLSGSDNCSGQSTVRTAGLASGSAFPIGITTNTFKVTDAVGNTKTCSFTVSVNDNELPAISCPVNITSNNDVGACTAVETYTTPSGTDNCTGQITTRTSGLASGSAFPIGVTTNTFKVTDASGNTKTCSFTVTVNDNELPAISCPANIVTTNDAGVCTAIETYATPSGTDNCSGQSTTRTAGLASGSAFPNGVTTNTFKVTDASGNTKTCSFTVTVNDAELPAITCPVNIVTSNDAGVCTAFETYSTPMGTDNCSGQSTTQTAGLASGSAFPKGVTANTFKVTDANGNTNTCSFTVTVNDSELPAITCPSNIVTGNDAGVCTAVETYTSPLGTDNCSGQSTMQTAGLASGSAFPNGVTTNTFKVTDASGNTKTCSFTITVNDNELPVISCPANIVTENDPEVCTAVETYATPAGADNCTGQNTIQTAGLASGSAFPNGVTTNTFKVTDASGNTKTCSFTITVYTTAVEICDNNIDDNCDGIIDDGCCEPPVITDCPSYISVNTTTNTCKANVNYSVLATGDPTPTYTYVFSGATNSSGAGTGTGLVFDKGVTNVAVTSTNGCGDNAICNFTITVNDVQIPAITCPANMIENAIPNTCSKTVTFTAPVGTDNCSGSTTVQLNGLPSGSTFNTGITTNTYKVTDGSGNTKTCSFTIQVKEPILPTLTCPANIVEDADPGECSAIVIYTVTSSDNCPGLNVSYTQLSGTEFIVGITTVTVLATDASDNTKSCSFTVTINDIEDPVVSCPDIEKILDIGANTAIVNLSVNATDNCSNVTTTFIPVSGTAFEFGTTAVTSTVTDDAGNSTTCNFNVHVIDLEPPVATCPLEDVELDAIEGHCFGEAEYSTSYSDNVQVDYSYFDPYTSNSRYDVGTTVVTYTVVDIAGNSNSCTFNVIVYDTQDPVLTCPDTMKIQLNAGVCNKIVWYTSSASDNCADPTIVYTPSNGSTLGIGNAVVNGTVTDGSGNTSTCKFVVSIKAAAEICNNNIDDDCDGLTDEGCNDTDGDGIDNSVDNCKTIANPGQEDSDCDGVGNVCDVCAGGDDKIDNDNNGLPDCKNKPANYSSLPASWKCGSNKAYVCHIVGNYKSTCVTWSLVQAHLNHGDYLGPCNQVKCNTLSKDESDMPSLEQFGSNYDDELSIDITPNPNDGNFVLHLDGLQQYHGIIEIVNIAGKVIYYSEIDNTENHVHLNLDLRNLVEGNYLLKYKDKEYVFNKLIVVVK
ncbi:MAG: HYR domain-containing protein [Saprospiraceae bacterium]|nr:HYR domain-containing protein [Saprospiraceae bacterium]